MMHMTFYWGKKVTLLIDSWKTDSWTSYVLSLLACLIVTVFYQFLENRRIRLKLFAAGEIQAPLLQNGPKLGVKLARALLFAVISAVGYLLMLAVMSFNVGVFVAVVLGLAIGYFFFRSDGEDSTAHARA